jgi:hypothetical protein
MFWRKLCFNIKNKIYNIRNRVNSSSSNSSNSSQSNTKYEKLTSTEVLLLANILITNYLIFKMDKIQNKIYQIDTNIDINNSLIKDKIKYN